MRSYEGPVAKSQRADINHSGKPREQMADLLLGIRTQPESSDKKTPADSIHMLDGLDRGLSFRVNSLANSQEKPSGQEEKMTEVAIEESTQDNEESYDSEGRKIATLEDGAPRQSEIEASTQDSEESYDSEGRKIATLEDGAPQQSKNIESSAPAARAGVSVNRLTEVGTEATTPILDSENIKPEVQIDRLTEVGTEGIEEVSNPEYIEPTPKEQPIDRLTEVGTEATTPILDSENIKSEVQIDRLTEVGTEGTERVENPEVLPPPRENGAEVKESAESRAARIAQLESELANERTEYLRVDYQKNTAFSRIRKFFGGIGKYVEDNKRMDDPELAQFRAYYDAKLMQLQEAVLADARERGASDEELAQVFAKFRVEQKITMASEHDRIKVEGGEETVTGYLKEKIVSLTNKYRALSPKTKIAIGLAMAAGGTLAAGAGGAAVGAMTVVAAARRGFMGAVAGTGAAAYLEGRGQKKDDQRLQRETKQFLEQLKGLSQEEKYNVLSGKIDGMVIDRENSVNKIKNQDIRQLTAATAYGTLVGSGLLGQWIKAGYHEVGDYFKSFGGSVAEAGASTIEAIPQHLSVQSGGSIEGELIKHLKATVPDMANPGQQAHRMLLEYAKVHDIPFDKLNHIYPGTTIDIDPNTHQILGLDAKFMPEVTPTPEVAQEVVDHSNHLQHTAVEPQPTPSPVEAPPQEMSAPRPGSMPEQPVFNQDAAFAQETNADLQAERTAVNEDLLRAEQRYGNLSEAARVAHEETTNARAFMSENQFGSNPTMEGFEKEAALRDAMKATHEDIHKLFAEKGILDNPDLATEVKDMRKFMFGGDVNLFREVRAMGAQEFLNNTQEEILRGPGPDGVNADVWQGKSALLKCASVIPPRVNETVAHWTLRVVEDIKRP